MSHLEAAVGSMDPRDTNQHQALTWSHLNFIGGSKVPPSQNGAASVVVKGPLYMFGGYSGKTGRLDDFDSFFVQYLLLGGGACPVQGEFEMPQNNGVVIEA